MTGKGTELTTIVYGIALVISLVLTGSYIYMWHKHFDVNFTMIFTLVPISCVGYYLSSVANDLGGALASVQVMYLGGCFLQLFILMSILNLSKIDVKRIIRVLIFVPSTVIYVSILTVGKNRLFYKSYSFDIRDKVPVLVKEYGIMHTVFYILLVLLFAAGIAVIVYAWFRKKEAPRKLLMLLIIPDAVCVLSYFMQKILPVGNLELIPIGYCLSEFTYLLIARRVNLYDVGDTVIDSMVQEEAIGYISFDFNYSYLGSNEVAKILVPELNNLAVDEKFGYKTSERRIRHFLEDYKRDPANNKYLYTIHGNDGNPDNDRYYDVVVKDLYEGNRKRGYILLFTDDTENKKYIRLLDTYNDDLKNEVDEKTKHIVQMHDNLIMSLAMMVESRDNSTGGHIKRTSEGVRILIDEIIKEGQLELDPEFCKDVIKAAPMHDLGKIAVDDAVLKKPGRFTDEEYNEMKKHAAEGARVIHEILLNTDDERFKNIAENVAHYHHERYDGSGYPEKLEGEQIPLEARIMAIADVYDALVSKRVYKEAFDFARADSIIMEGMGTQFDPKLKSAYEKARPRLEEYYSKV